MEPETQLKPFPDHTQLPAEDGTFVKNFQEHPQSILLTDSLASVLAALHPDGQYAIGQDSGIYWRVTDPPERGSEAPDWFYIPNVPPLLDGQFRRSYVLWREHMAPLIAIEFASGDGSEERDNTPLAKVNGNQKPGKFWVYERIVRIPYYAIFEMANHNLEVYHLQDLTYHKQEPNERGHYPIAPMSVELGLWAGTYQNLAQTWLRWWDLQGNLLLTGAERSQQTEAALQAERQAKQEAERELHAERQAKQETISRFLQMGLTPQQVAEAMGMSPNELGNNGNAASGIVANS